jgi:hypothetical protein
MGKGQIASADKMEMENREETHQLGIILGRNYNAGLCLT